MKTTRLFLLTILLCLTASLSVQAQSDAFYIYRNDGQFNAFFDADVDSITYSHYDADSLYHTDWQMQVVHTADSVYRIPLEVIDSISLVTPETKLQSGVIEIKDELRDYVLSATDSTVLFSSSIPHMLLPSIGQLVVTTEMSDVFPAGFAGEVISVEKNADGYMMECAAASLEDIFETFYSVNHGNSEQTRAGIVKSGSITVGPTTVLLLTPALENLSHSVKVKDDYAIDVSPYFDLSLTTQFDVSSMVIIDNIHGTYINLSCIGDYKAWEKIAFSGTFSYRRDFGKALQVPIPVCPFVSFYVEPGFFVNASVEGGFSHEWTQHYRSAFLYEYSSKGQEVLKPVNRLIPVDYTHSGEATVKGSIAAGGYVESGFAIKDKNFVNVHIRGEIGLELESNAVLYKDEANTCRETYETYDQLHESGIFFNWYYGTAAEAEFLKYTASYELPWGYKGRIASMAHVPTFTNVSLTADETDKSKAHASAKSSGGCILPQSVGLVLMDEDGNEVEKVYHSQKHYIQPKTIEHTFTGLEPGNKYRLYPIVHAYGMEMLASPMKELSVEVEVQTVGCNSVTQNSAIVQGRIVGLKDNNGYTYGICYATSADEWQYVQASNISSDGNFSVSLTGLKPETTYYYCAYLYQDGNYLYDDSSLNFTTEKSSDEPTPGEAIDLGLSVKWASHNVGASSPEGYGGYYAWGETEEKSNYTYETYKYWSDRDGDGHYDENEYQNIGSNISGTQYDVAHVKWGGSWRMPTFSEILKLVYNCTWKWTTYNGVNGQLVTGPNGNSIFLPAAGFRNGTELLHRGSIGDYWSATLDGHSSCNAFSLYFYDGFDFWYIWNHRDLGHTVRPVTD